MLERVSILLLLVALTRIIYGTESDKFFRIDYTYLRNTESFYKIHTLLKTWEQAKITCEREGAMLFYPEDADEAEAVINYWNETQPFIEHIFIGVSAWNAQDVFDTVDGRPISHVYNVWGYGEPNNLDGTEGCVVMQKDDGALNDDNCSRRVSFVCKKSLATLQWNTLCDLPDPLYEYNSLLDRCYKFHLTPRNWTEAYTVCRAEQSYLAVINSEQEAVHLVNMTANAPKDDVKGNYLRGAIHIGFKYKDGWITATGVPLHQSGYSAWGFGLPDGGDKEKCGSMFYTGQLNDIECFHKMFFICEHEMRL